LKDYFNKMNTDETNVYDKLVIHGFINNWKDWNDYTKMIAVKICQNDLTYLKKNFVPEAHPYIRYATPRHYTGRFVSTRLIIYMFAIACAFSSNIKILLFFLTNCEIFKSTFALDSSTGDRLPCIVRGYDEDVSYLALACAFNTNISIIQFLVDDCALGIDFQPSVQGKCSAYACMYNTNVEIIKYLLSKQTVVFCQTPYSNDFFTLACKKNTSFDVIEYFLNLVSVTMTIVDNHNKDTYYRNCFKALLGRKYQHDALIIVNFILAIANNKIFENLSDDDWNVLGEPLRLILETFNNADLVYKIIQNNKNNSFSVSVLDPDPHRHQSIHHSLAKKYIFDQSVYDRLNIVHPAFDDSIKYSEFVEMVDRSCKTIKCPRYVFKNYPDASNDQKYDVMDFSQNHELLFKCNGECYYGIRSIAYESMLIFSDYANYINFKDTVELNIDVPKYIMNMYVLSLHVNRINFNDIKPCDIESFIHLVDKYSTTFLSINSIENDVVKFYSKHGIKPSDCIKNVWKRYKLKYTYAWMVSQSPCE
jgi:hypothetical protein